MSGNLKCQFIKRLFLTNYGRCFPVSTSMLAGGGRPASASVSEATSGDHVPRAAGAPPHPSSVWPYMGRLITASGPGPSSSATHERHWSELSAAPPQHYKLWECTAPGLMSLQTSSTVPSCCKWPESAYLATPGHRNDTRIRKYDAPRWAALFKCTFVMEISVEPAGVLSIQPTWGSVRIKMMNRKFRSAKGSVCSHKEMNKTKMTTIGKKSPMMTFK